MKLNKTELDELTGGFYLFTTSNCPTCEKLKNLLKEIEVEDSVFELDAYAHQKIAIKQGLMGTPCLLDIRNGKEYDRMYGAPSRKRVEAFLKGE